MNTISSAYSYEDIIHNLQTVHQWAKGGHIDPSPAPLYNKELADSCGVGSNGLGLAVADMKNHMTDEGWQLFQALEVNGYKLAGKDCSIPFTRYEDILERYISLRKQPPGTLVLQDKREWDSSRNTFRNKDYHFHTLHLIKNTTSTFKLTVLKDSQHEPVFHRISADEIGCHAWITYYHPKVVNFLAPYLRSQHCVRTYHSIDSNRVPEFKPSEKKNCALLSGAISKYYPLRSKIRNALTILRNRTVRGMTRVDLLTHPGYGNTTCYTYEFLKTLSRYKVAIVTSSLYGYALRKFPEATACGCTIITDLPQEEELPIIDGNLIRIHPDASIREIQEIVDYCIDSWSEEKQKFYSDRAKLWYNYPAVGQRLVQDIESLRQRYSNAI